MGQIGDDSYENHINSNNYCSHWIDFVCLFFFFFGELCNDSNKIGEEKQKEHNTRILGGLRVYLYPQE